MSNQSLEWDVFFPITYPGIRVGKYIISKNGTIKDLGNGYFVKDNIDMHGFSIVPLYTVANKFEVFRVHRLVAWEFCCDNRKLNYGVSHIDGNKLNNDCDNLIWIAPESNKEQISELDDIILHIHRTNKNHPYSQDPNAFHSYIQRSHPDQKITKAMITRVLASNI